MSKKIIESKEDFENYVIDAVEYITERQVPDGRLPLSNVCEGIGQVLEIVQYVENKLHLIIDDMCLEENIQGMTITDFAEHLRQNILP